MNGYLVRLVVSMMNSGGASPVQKRALEARAARLRMRPDAPDDAIQNAENAAEAAAQEPREIARFTRQFLLPAPPFMGLALANVGPFMFEPTTIVYDAETEQYDLIEVSHLCHMQGADCACQNAVKGYMADDGWEMIAIYEPGTDVEAESKDEPGDDE